MIVKSTAIFRFPYASWKTYKTQALFVVKFVLTTYF